MTTRAPRAATGPRGATLTPPRAARRVRTAGVGLAVGLALSSLVGCGIRSTSVPVDAGPAPTRVSCATPEATAAPTADDSTLTRTLYLVCSGRVLAVPRVIWLPKGNVPTDRLALARVLLNALRTTPPAETDRGFSTDVPAELQVNGPRAGDARGVLRLSQPPTELPAFSLAQLVCTFASTAVGGAHRSVVLGGPDHTARQPPLRYACDRELRSDPKSARAAGVPY